MLYIDNKQIRTICVEYWMLSFFVLRSRPFLGQIVFLTDEQ